METLDLRRYFDERGRELILNEHRLRDLGLTVIKTEVAKAQQAGSAGVLSLFDLAFERRDEKFSPELIRFLETEIKLSPVDIDRLERQAVHAAE